jgi:hypothetical protein
MSLTGNYEAAFELSEGVVRDIFIEAHRSGEIPHEIMVDDTIQGLNAQAIVKILQTSAAGELNLDFETPVANGIQMTLPLDIEITVENAPAPSINPIKFAAALEIIALVQGLPDAAGNKELVLNLAGLPEAQVLVRMPPAEVIQVTDALIEDGLHKAYDDELIPHTVTYAVPGFGDTTIDVLDDDADPSKQIKFAMTAADRGTLTLPIFIHVSSGLEEIVQIHNIRLTPDGDWLIIDFSQVQNSDVTTSPLLSSYAPVIGMMVRSYPPYNVFVPRNATIAGIIVAAARSRLDSWGADGNGRLHLYTPNSVENTPIEIVDFDTVVKPGFLGVLFNPMAGADAASVDNFIPAGKKFAQALAEPVVQRLIEEALQTKVLDENGCSGWPCTFDHEIEGHEVTLTSKPKFKLKNGHIQMNGSAEVAIDCWFDPDVDFEAKVDFHFGTNAEGEKIIVPNVYDEDVDLDCLDWFLGFIIPIYGWIALIVVVTVVDSVGGEVVSEEGDNVVKGTEYIAGEIHGVGGVTTELDRIDVVPEGIILSGGTFIASAHQALTIVPSESGAPYSGKATALISLQSIHYHAKALYHWEFGDGEADDGYMIQHRYIDDGIYIARLTTNVIDPTGVITHHFGRIKVLNAPPVVDAGPDILAKEGEVIQFTGRFTDAEYVDKHVARWSWGDDSMSVGQVVETHAPPQGEGTVNGQHRYCDNGEYTVTLRVIDNDGSMARDSLRVRVENVPPRVDAGEEIFAYPCAPVTLAAGFTDPGWCDTHTGVWDFGDCSEPLPATIREKVKDQTGIGIAAASHVYERCGTYLATCTVLDDDGGIGSDRTVVRVVELKNADFEGGFRHLRVGVAANHWEPYPYAVTSSGLAALDAAGSVTEAFRAEQFVVHGGQRSQCIFGTGRLQAGIFQALGANPGWDYQVSAWYHLDERSNGNCRLGVDPKGGADPDAADVVWSAGMERQRWTPLQVRVTAASRSLTIFLQAESDRGAVAYFDDVSVVPCPCPLEWPPVEPEPQPEPEERAQCVDWADSSEAQDVGRVYQKEGFTFQSFAKDGLRIVLWGIPEKQGKLALPAKGLRIRLPFEANRIEAHVVLYTGRPVQVSAMDNGGNLLGRDTTPEAQRQIHTLQVRAEGITSLEFAGGGNEGLLVKLCVYQQPREDRKQKRRSKS